MLETGILKSTLFQGLTPEAISRLLEETPYQKTVFHREELIYAEGDTCEALGLIVRGKVEVKHLLLSGKEIQLTTLEEGDVFGEALLFGENKQVPISLFAAEECTVYFFLRQDLLQGLFAHRKVFENYLSLLSDKIFLLNEKVRLLGLDSIRKKVIWFLLRQSRKDCFSIRLNREQMAKALAVPRPSLSRELAHLQSQGLIEYKGRTFCLKDRDTLEDELAE